LKFSSRRAKNESAQSEAAGALGMEESAVRVQFTGCGSVTVRCAR